MQLLNNIIDDFHIGRIIIAKGFSIFIGFALLIREHLIAQSE